jgi:hypothetical protein
MYLAIPKVLLKKNALSLFFGMNGKKKGWKLLEFKKFP